MQNCCDEYHGSYLSDWLLSLPDLSGGSLLQQLTRDQHMRSDDTEQEDPGFVEESVKLNEEKPLEYYTPLDKMSPEDIQSTDMRLCQAVEKAFADLLKVVLRKHGLACE